jgi:hypothetical protein
MISLIQSIRKLAADFPDAVYSVEGYCQYTEGKCGPGQGCLVGQGMQNCGMGEMAEDADILGEIGVSSFFSKANVKNKNDRNWLIKIQGNQDNGKPWADAVRLADASFELVSKPFRKTH